MNKKKTLLNENTIRQFMKLADIGELQENYFDKYEELQEAEYDRDDELGVEDLGGLEGAEDVDVDVDVAAEELPVEGGVSEATIESLVDAIATAIEDETGIPVTVESTPSVEGELETDVAPELDIEGGDVEVGGEEEELGGLTELLDDANIQVVDNDAIVQEVLKRVAKRLIRQKIRS